MHLDEMPRLKQVVVELSARTFLYISSGGQA
jgi:hypothetical protein